MSESPNWTARQIVRKAATPVVLLLLVALLAFGAYWGWKLLTTPIPPKPPEPCVTQDVGPALTSDKVTVRVFNGGKVTGQASKIGSQLKSVGFNVTRTANTDREIGKTVVLGSSPDNPEVQLVARFFADGFIEGDDRPDNTVDVFIGAEFAGMYMDAPTEIAIPGGDSLLAAHSNTRSLIESRTPQPCAGPDDCSSETTRPLLAT